MKLEYDSAITLNSGSSYTINLGGRLDVLLDANEKDFTLEFIVNSQLQSRWNAIVEVKGPSSINVQNVSYSSYYKLVMKSNYNMEAYTTSLATDVYYRISRVEGIITIYIKLLSTGNTYYHSIACTDTISSIYIGNYNHENNVTGYIKDLKFTSESSKNYYFRANFQNTLEPQLGTFTNEGNKPGVFTLENGEYYLTNNTSTAYREYYSTNNILEGSYTIECDVYFNPSTTSFRWLLLFNGNGSNNWWGLASRSDVILGVYSKSDTTLSNKRNTWLHIKIETTCMGSQCIRDIYVDGVLATSVVHEIRYDISYIDILGNSGSSSASPSRIKNVVIYSNIPSFGYLNREGLKQVWKNIKSYHKACMYDYYTKEEVDTLISNIAGVGTQEVYSMEVLSDDVSAPARVIEDDADTDISEYTEVESADEVEEL